jgi:very-short-patch-repair endonuclease
VVKVVGVDRFLAICGTPDQKVVAIAEAQRGRVARRQLLAAGVTPSMIKTMLASGWLHPLHRGVYAVGHLAPVELGRETAALLACRGSAALSHHTTARLWKICPWLDADGPIDVTVPRGVAGQPKGIRFHRTRALKRQDIRTFEGLPVTSPARTLLDIAPHLDSRSFERALDEALLQRLVSNHELERMAFNARGHRGAPLLAGALARHSRPTVTDSEAEEIFFALMRDAQLPEPEVHARIHGYTVDFLWRAQRLVVEVDGYKYHSSRVAFERDSKKSAKLAAAGFHVMRVTWRQMKDEPCAVIVRVAQALVRAEAE